MMGEGRANPFPPSGSVWIRRFARRTCEQDNGVWGSHDLTLALNSTLTSTGTSSARLLADRFSCTLHGLALLRDVIKGKGF